MPTVILPGVAQADEMQPDLSTVVRGVVTVKGRTDLPEGTRLAVMLEDVSLADAPAVTLSKTVFAPVGTQGFGYALSYDQSSLKPGHRYMLRAEIRAGDRLLYTSKAAVIATGAVPEQHEIVVEPVSALLPVALVGSWTIDKIGENRTAPEAPAVIVFGADGSLSGTAGCNRMMGHITATEQDLSFGPVAGTRMACPGVRMTQETAVFTAFDQVKTWSLQKGNLLLVDAQGNTVLTLAPEKNAQHPAGNQSRHIRNRKSQ